MFTQLLEDTFPQGTAQTDTLIPLGKTFCKAVGTGLKRYEIQKLATGGGVTGDQASQLLRVSVTTLCATHQDLLDDPIAAPAKPDMKALAAQLDDALSARFPRKYLSLSTHDLIYAATYSCRAVENGYDAESVAGFWVDAFKTVNFNLMGEAAGMAVGVFCPNDAVLITP